MTLEITLRFLLRAYALIVAGFYMFLTLGIIVLKRKNQLTNEAMGMYLLISTACVFVVMFCTYLLGIISGSGK